MIKMIKMIKMIQILIKKNKNIEEKTIKIK